MSLLIGAGEDWNINDLLEMNDAIEEIALKEMGYNIYPNQIEIITSEQMLDAYSSVGLPVMYHHWTFGKDFLTNKKKYDAGRQGLAYEIVINTDPCIVYIMENNTKLMQALVIAHAGIGHNHFFKNNQLFTQWTKADNIIDYMEFAQKFITKCEEKYGVGPVEDILNCAHSIQSQGVFRYPRKEKMSLKKEMDRKIMRALEQESSFDPIWETTKPDTKAPAGNESKRQDRMHLPEENLLYFLEKNSPILKIWQREILRIVRNVAQYFYPQGQTKVMNEGCATYSHYTILNRMYDKGMLSDGAMFEFLKSHTGVTYQPTFDSPHYSGINPYALGSRMMDDIVRICNEPTQEDKDWFPNIAGCKDSFNVLTDAWKNHRDESFIRQFLSPKVIRDMKLFSIANNPKDERSYAVSSIANETGYRNVRSALANSHDVTFSTPEIEITDADMTGNRELKMRFRSPNGSRLAVDDLRRVITNIHKLWGYSVTLTALHQDGSTHDTYRIYHDVTTVHTDSEDWMNQGW